MTRTRTISDEALLEAARDVFCRRGFAASTTEIARRARVSQGVLFQRYATKAELFFAAMVPPAVDLRPRLEGWLAKGDMAWALEQLMAALLDYFRAAVPVLMALATHPDFDFEAFARRHPASSLAALRADMVAFFEMARARGLETERDPGATSLVLIASMCGMALFERVGVHGGHFPPVLITRVAERMWPPPARGD
jgi:AcrR family transcriptional regulator